VKITAPAVIASMFETTRGYQFTALSIGLGGGSSTVATSGLEKLQPWKRFSSGKAYATRTVFSEGSYTLPASFEIETALTSLIEH
jgi:hypothetical protein